ncbi:hypothetical protein DFJ63DRAFT_176023 [Scheffersomyces coipomensis]|uniref:uncharacterized protein n=1 Tax=Scheffersomyces coipomensis TaxID=1788519 RepID=UPI00315D8BCA
MIITYTQNKVLRSLKSQYFSNVIRFVSFVLSSPRRVILIPSLLIFILSYGVVYDFTIKQINSQLAYQFGGANSFQFNHDKSYTIIHNLLDDLNHYSSLQNDQTLSCFILSRKSDTISQDATTVLDYSFFHNLDHLQSNLTQQFQSDNITLISPLSGCPLIFESKYVGDAKINRNFKSYIIRYLNYELNNLLTFLFVDDIRKSNHLIKYAKTLRIFIIHPTKIKIENHITDYLQHDNSIQLDNVIHTDHNSSLKGFIQYYLIQNNAAFWIRLFIRSSNWLIYSSMIAFIFYIYLSLANAHKIRSVIGLLIGWLVAILISSCAAINVVTTLHGYKSWRLIFEPSTPFTKGSYIFTIMIFSTKNLFTTVKVLSDSTTESEPHKRLYKLYTGFYGTPIISKNLLFNLICLFGVYMVGSTILFNYIDGYFYTYISHRLSSLNQSIVISLIFEYLLELAYLSGIIIIDLKRFDLTDIINYHQQSNNSNLEFLAEEDEEDIDKKALDSEGGNLISSYLLHSKRDPTFNVDRNSLRYKLGQFFLRINYSEEYNTPAVFLTSIGLIQLLGIFMHWVIIIPYSTLNNSKDMIRLGENKIWSNNNNFIYYLELLSILLFIVASSSIAFNLTVNNNSTSTNGSKPLEKADFEQVNRYFNAVELKKDTTHGHSLDVLKIATNSKTSFVITVGLDRKILIWSPLNGSSLSEPINISSKVESGPFEGKEFWPINHVSISDDGSYVMLICFKYGLIKCYERRELNFKWELELPTEVIELIKLKKFKISEYFFRRKTVPGVLARKMLLKKGQKKKGSSTALERRDSNASIASMNSQINGNFPPPPISMKSFSEQQRERNRNEPTYEQMERELIKVEFILVLESGHLVTFSCVDGGSKILNLMAGIHGLNEENLTVTSAKKVTTPRINDRIVCQLSNSDVIVATVVNNTWRLRKLPIVEGHYNQGPNFVQPVNPMSSMNNKYSQNSNDFRSVYNSKLSTIGSEVSLNVVQEPIITNKDSKYSINKATVMNVDFVGMIVVVKDQVAELVDVQSGIVLKKFNVGRFKPNTFRVSHSEPTHCKFCGCASIQSFSIAYEDYDTPTLIVHTYKIELKRSKNNICLRVERDPREIRCLGFNAVTEHQYWFNGLVGWELTDVNMIIGLKRKDQTDDDTPTIDEEIINESDIKMRNQNIDKLIQNSGLMSLRSRHSKNIRAYNKSDKSNSQLKPITVEDVWEGFIITLIDGKLINYQIPLSNSLRDTELIMSKINSVEKYGYKSIIFSVGRITDIFYLGNDTLIEDDLYYSGTNATIASVLEEDAQQNNKSRTGNNVNTKSNPPVNSELLFINKRRKMRDKHLGGSSNQSQSTSPSHSPSPSPNPNPNPSPIPSTG